VPHMADIVEVVRAKSDHRDLCTSAGLDPDDPRLKRNMHEYTIRFGELPPTKGEVEEVRLARGKLQKQEEAKRLATEQSILDSDLQHFDSMCLEAMKRQHERKRAKRARQKKRRQEAKMTGRQ
jgi:hypothetical protein